MTAPALIALAPGDADARSTRAHTALVRAVRALRPDRRIEAAFGSSLPAVVDRLVGAGHDELVVVPLLLTEGSATLDVPAATVQLLQEAAHEAVAAVAATPCPPASR